MTIAQYYTSFHATKIRKKKREKDYPSQWYAHILYWFQCKRGLVEKKTLENSAGRAKKLSHNQLVLHKDYTRQIEHICCENVH